MNVLQLGCAAILGVAASAAAGAASLASDIAVAGVSKVVVDCKSTQAPHTADVAAVVGAHDFWQAFAARQRVVALAKPACARGVDAVEFVATGVDRVADELALAAAEQDSR